MPVDARAEYPARHAARSARAAALAARERRIGTWRLVLVGAAALLAWLAFGLERLPGWSVGPPLLGFLALVVAHARIIPARREAERAAAFYAAGVARLEERWRGQGRGGDEFLDAAHPYAADLDLFGSGSLFERLCTARTHAGAARLADWLRAPAPPDEVRARQAAVEELRARLDLREELAALGDAAGGGLDLAALAAWGAA
ncbi:MAG: DNA mismatch repair protein MutS, partial [Deltaproteobacteria bacterium]|nr:DNA mismatch repair protein MutS [Deltaproteobacteria bacterium]